MTLVFPKARAMDINCKNKDFSGSSGLIISPIIKRQYSNNDGKRKKLCRCYFAD
jgi:hypothetical protein